MTTNSPCPLPQTLQLALLGQLPDDEAVRIEEHLLECAACQETSKSLETADALIAACRAAPAIRKAHDELATLMKRIAQRLGEGDTHSSASRNEITPALTDVRLADALALQTTPPVLRPALAEGELGRLGPFRVLRQLGQGGMGVVFEAEDMQLRRPVALKVLQPALSNNSDHATRFLREAQAAAAVRHDHIVTIYQVGQDGETPFLAMELLQGESLEERLKRDERLSVAETLRIGREAAEGLSAAHACGLLHRDIKPANIWLEERNRGTGVRSQGTGGNESTSWTPDSRPLTPGPSRVKILDFGLARAIADDAQLTSTGLIVGTPSYMAPEQVDGQHVDARADLFSLGCALYRACTGLRPFRGGSSLAVLKALASETPAAPSSINSEVPTALSDFIMLLLAKDPNKRPASAVAVVTKLTELEAATSVSSAAMPARRAPRRYLRSRNLIAATAALVLLAGLIVIIRDRHDKEIARVHVPEARGATITVEPNESASSENHAPLAAIAPFNAKRARAHQEAWAKYLATTVESSNSIEMKMVLIPAGEYLMGCTDAEVTEALEELPPNNQDVQESVRSGTPQRKVALTEPIYMSSHEVTHAQYVAVMGQQNAPKGSKLDAKEHPITNVSWNDAAEFCAKLSESEQLMPYYFRSGDTVTMLKGTGYRLPTEAEWEFACRAGTETKFWPGNDDKSLNQAGWFHGNSGGHTHSTGDLAANPFGLYDVHGNVWEWCDDWYDSSWYERRPLNSSTGPAVGIDRSVRGGSFHNHPANCRSAFRFHNNPTLRNPNLGFRVVRVVVTSPSDSSALSSRKVSTATPAVPSTSRPVDSVEPKSWLPGPSQNILPGLAPRPAKLPGIERWQVDTVAPRSEMSPIGLPVQWSPDGRFLTWNQFAARSLLRVSELVDGRLHLRNIIPATYETELCWSPNSRLLVVAGRGENKTVVWAVDSGAGVAGHLQPCWGSRCAWSPNGRWVACGYTATTGGGEIGIWNAETYTPVTTLPVGPEADFSVPSWTSDSSRLALADRRGKQVLVWNTDGWQLASRREVNFQPIGAEWTKEGTELLISGGAHLSNGQLEFWNPVTDAVRLQLNLSIPHNGSHLSPDGKWFTASVGSSGFQLMSSANGQRGVAIEAPTFSQYFWHPHGGLLWVSPKTGSAGLYDFQSKQTNPMLQPLLGSAGVKWSTDGQRIATYGDQFVRLWDATGRRPWGVLEAGDNDVTSVDWRPSNPMAQGSGNYLATGDSRGRCILWNAESRQAVDEFNASGRVYAVAFSPDGQWLACGGSSIMIWDCERRQRHRELKASDGWVKNLAWSTNNRDLAAIWGDKKVRVWDAIEAVEISSYEETASEFLTWTRDGQWIVGSNLTRRDGTPADKPLLMPRQSGTGILYLAPRWDRGGTCLVESYCAGNSGIRVQTYDLEQWKTESEFSVKFPENSGWGAVKYGAWSPDGKSLAVAFSPGAVLDVVDGSRGDTQWRAVILPEGRSATISAAGEVAFSDTAAENELVYYIQLADGSIETLTPLEFRKRVGVK